MGKVSEKSLELNVGAEILNYVRHQLNMSKAYLRGLTQREEHLEGVDFYVKLPQGTKLFAFQFKAAHKGEEVEPYRFRIQRQQHEMLYSLAQSVPNSVFYVFPYYVTPNKLQQDVPNLLSDTWFLPLDTMEPGEVFKQWKSRTVRCSQGLASINPEYRLIRFFKKEIPELTEFGIGIRHFVEWYVRFLGSKVEATKLKRNPWLVRGLRMAICPPEHSL